MKQLSIEQKAKRYDEAIERARYWEKNPTVWSSDDICQKLFPELKESEDDRIRKELLNHLKNASYGKTLIVNTSDYKRWADWLEKQGEQKPAWSEEDKKAMSRINYLLYTNCANVEGEYLEKWLNSLKDRVLSQPKQEWSEEDKEIIINIGEYLNRYGNYLVESNEEKAADVYKSADWLKSLKERYTWKPSDEQMEALEFVIKSLDNMLRAIGHIDNVTKPRLEEILAALKKLK